MSVSSLNNHLSAKELTNKNVALPTAANEERKAEEGSAIERDSLLGPVSEKAVIKAIERANKVTLTHNTRAEFSVHEETKHIIVKVYDTKSNEVIREFPPKKFLDLLAKLWDLAGILVDERR